MLDTVFQLLDNFENEIIEFRRYFHQYPELSFHEEATAAYICQHLDQWEIPYKRNIAGYGICALLKGQNPDLACVALRADMDALPVTESSGVDFSSLHEGVMHACGHDAHMAMLLGAAKALNDSRHLWKGSIKLIFQPAEEKVPGGAFGMIEAGILENPKVSAVFGLHVNPDYETGYIAVSPGPVMASVDEINIHIIGKGGHGAKPQQGVDPILTGANLVCALQQLNSRLLDPVEPVVLTFGIFKGEGNNNVIPDDVFIEGTLRTASESVRTKAQAHIQRIVSGIAEASQAKIDLRIVRGYPSLTNDEELARNLKKSACTHFGNPKVQDLPLAMWSEDFAYFSQQRKACFFNLGIQNSLIAADKAIHTSNFKLDEKALLTGAKLLSMSALETLKKMT